jgi:multidrug efflux system membrane fusion protein
MTLQEMNPTQRTEPHPHAPAPALPAPKTSTSGKPVLNHDASPKHASRWWVWLIILIVLGVGGYFLVTRIHEATAQSGSNARGGPKSFPVVAGIARKGDMPVYLTGLGTVTAFQTVTVHSRVDGELTKVYFTEGQIVKQGDPLVEIDPRPFEVMVTQADGQLAKDQAQLQNDQLDLNRYVSIKDSITQQQIDTQKALVAQMAGAVKTDEGQLANARLQLSYCKINSPISGRVGLRLVDGGNLVHATDPNGLLVVTQIQPIAVYFYLREDDIQKVFDKVNAGQTLKVDALDTGADTVRASGTLLATDNQVDTTTGTLRFKAVFANEDNSLFPNQFVNVRLLIDTLKGVVIVPAAAVQHGPDGEPFIYVAKKAPATRPAADASTSGEKPTEKSEGVGPTSKPSGEEQVVELRNVTVGHQEGDQIVITSGITPGEMVITDGVDKLQADTKVTVRMQRPASTRASKGGATSRPADSARPAGRSGRRGNS